MYERNMHKKRSVKYEQIHRELKNEMLITQREFTNSKWKTAVLELEYIDNTDAKKKETGKQEFFKVKLYHTLLITKLKGF